LIKDQERHEVVTNRCKDMLTENDQITSTLEDIDINMEGSKSALIQLNDALSESATLISSKDTEISEKLVTLEQLVLVQEMIDNQKLKLGELDNEILRLGEHENHVKSEIQDQGKVESDRMEKEISEAQSNIDDIKKHIENLEIKKLQDEESFNSKVNAIKNQRNETISKAVERGIQEIDVKLKRTDESHRANVANSVSKRNELSLTSKSGIIKKKGSEMSQEKYQNSTAASEEAKPPSVPKETDVDMQVDKSINELSISEKGSVTKGKDSDMAESEVTDSDSDPFAMSDESEDSKDENLAPNTSNTSVRRSPAIHSCIDQEPKHNLSMNGTKVIPSNSTTPGRSKRFLATKAQSKSALGRPQPTSSNLTKTSHTSPAVTNPTTPSSNRTKRVLVASSKPSKAPEPNQTMATSATPSRTKRVLLSTPKPNYLSGASSADEDVLKNPVTPGSRKDKKRFLITKKSN